MTLSFHSFLFCSGEILPHGLFLIVTCVVPAERAHGFLLSKVNNGAGREKGLSVAFIPSKRQKNISFL